MKLKLAVTLAGSPADYANQRSSGPATVKVSVESSGAVDGTNAPYVQLLACLKD